MLRKAKVYYQDQLAGWLSETEEGFSFVYDTSYLAQVNAQPISLTMPLRPTPYTSTVLFPFFDGLIPEGWLLDVALRNTDVSTLDRMSLLLLCCKDCIGAVGVEEIKEDE